MRRSGAEQLAQQPSTSNARAHAAATHAADASFAWLVSALAAFMAFWVLVLPGSWRVGLVPGLEQQYYEACVHAPTPVPSDVLVRFAAYPSIRYLHVLPSGLWSLLIPLQLLPRVGILQRAGRYHALLGRLFMTSSLLVLCGYCVMEARGVGIPHSASPAAALRCQAAWFGVTAIIAWRAAARRDFASHRAWVVRHLAAGGWVIVQRLLLFVMAPLKVMGLVTYDTEQEREGGFWACAVAAMVLCTLGAEAFEAYRARCVRRDRASRGEAKVQGEMDGAQGQGDDKAKQQ